MPATQFSIRSLQTLLDRVRRQIDPNGVIALDEVTEVLEEYVEILKETNERLQECDGLLREGHRAQALQLSEQEPDLFRVMELLEFHELPLWLRLIEDAGLPPPPTLLSDVAADLNEAYNLEKPLTDLMRMHRLHALAGSPLKTRLEFLRKIAQRDANNPLWPEDVRLYERARHLQIERELSAIEKRADASAAALLEREVRAGGWLEPPPAALIEECVRIHTHLRQSRARQQIKKLADQLHEACAARNEQQAQQLRTAWNGQVAMAQLPSSDAVFELVEPVFDWLDREEERRQRDRDHKGALAALDDALDNNVGRAELEKCFNQVTRYGAAPPEMSRKVELRLQTIEKRTRLMVWAGVALSLACLGVVAWGVSWFIGYRNNQLEIARHVAALQQLVTDQKLNEAEQFLIALQQKAPAAAETPEIKKLAADLTALQSKEGGRVQAREGALAAIRGAVDEDDWGKLELAMHDITAAEKLCATDVERREVQDLLTQIRSAVRKHQDAKDEAFVVELRDLAAGVQEVSASDLTRIGELKLQAEGMQNQARVSSELKRQVVPLLARLETLRSSDESRRKEQLALQQVREAAGNLRTYESALASYAKEFAGTARSKYFANVVQNDLPLLPTIDVWNRIVGQWSATDFRKVAPARARELLDELTAAVEKNGEHPAAAELKALEPFLEAVTRRIDETGNRTHKNLLKVLSDQRISGVEMLKTTDGLRYYFDELPREHTVRPGEFFDFFVFADPSLKDPKRMSIAIAKITNARRDARDPPQPSSFIWTSPQRRFRDGATKIVTVLNDDNWESQFNNLLLLLEGEPDMEPTLKLHLTSLILQMGCQGSYCLEQGFQPSLEVLQMVQADVEANWIDPNDDLGKRARRTAEDALEQLLPRGEGIKNAVEHYARLAKKPRGTQYVWAGNLLRSPEGKWQAEMFAKNLSEGAELVLASKSEAGALAFTTIGKFAAGKAELTAEALPAFAEGRPVLVGKVE
jgi:hypothetical protein